MIPRPSFVLDPARSRILDPRVVWSRGSVATFLRRETLLGTAPIDSRRISFGGAGKSLGALVEGAFTCDAQRSEELDNAFWTPTNLSVTANAVASPDGVATADKLVEDTATAQHFILRAVASGAAGVHTSSIYFKAAERTYGTLRTTVDGGTSSVRTVYDLSNGTAEVGATTGTPVYSYEIEPVFDGWFRCSLSVNNAAIAGVTYRAGLQAAPGGPANSYTGDGASGVYAWGFNYGIAPFATSYIKTTSAAVTRSADSASIPTSGWLTATRTGTIVVVARATPAPPSGVIQNLFSIDSGASTNLIEIRRTTSSIIARIVNGGVQQAALDVGQATARADFKVALSWRDGNIAACLDGGTPVVLASGTIPASLSTLRLGTDYANASHWNSTIERIAYYPAAVSQAELQQMTR